MGENPLATSPGKNMIITVTETSTKLIINNVGKKHKGVYRCTVSNASGSDAAKGEIKVLDRPEPPEGLTASVDGDKCVLMWKRSKDDGGAPIEHYQVERYELDRGCWMACGKSHGNTFDARGLMKGHEYRFRVSASMNTVIPIRLRLKKLLLGVRPRTWTTKCETCEQ